VRRFIEIAHEHGLKVMLDMIVSHTAEGHEWTRTRRDWINWSGDTPDKAWFKGLPNIDHDNLDASIYFVRNLFDWLRETGADAARIDAARHVETQFWRLFKVYWNAALPETTVMGEFWDGDPHCLAPFQNLHGLDSMFDFPLYHAIRDVFIDDHPFSRIARPRLSDSEAFGILDHDAGYRNAHRLVTFIGNHDTSRFFEAAGGVSRPDDAGARMKLAVTFLMTSRGIPQLYYGDELATEGGFDPDNRRDMPWRQIDGAAGAGKAAEESLARQMHAFTKKLITVRRGSRALRHGLTVTLYVTPAFFAYARCMLDELVIVALNNSAGEADVAVPVRQNPRLPSVWRNERIDGLSFVDELGGSVGQKLSNGTLRFRLPPRSGAVCRMMLAT
jgi:glycosidase